MKKVLILQNEGNSIGGVWFVNKMVGEALIKRGYYVEILNIRNDQNSEKLDHINELKVNTINEFDKWEIIHKKDLLDALRKIKISLFLKRLFIYFKDYYKLNKDFKTAKNYIIKLNPDYLITSHYQMIKCIPKSFLHKTINENHASFNYTLNYKDNIKTFKKYNKKIIFLWLCKASMKKAEQFGLKNNFYIYNPIKFSTKSQASVIKNKKLITISRLSSKNKRIDLMLEIANKVLLKHPEWSLELYGEEILEDKNMEVINSNNRIFLCGKTNDPKTKLLSSSIFLMTSNFEGFSLSILEANECGLPCVSFNYGESCKEQIINGKTGYIVNFNDCKEFEIKLLELMENKEKLEKMSQNAKEFAKTFNIEKIVIKWIKLFNKIDKGVIFK